MFGKKGAANTESMKGLSPQLLAVLPVDAKPWYRTSHLLVLNFLLLAPLLSAATVGFDGSMMNGLQTLKTWRNYFDRPNASLLGLINAIFPLGKLFGVFAASFASDRWGRKKVIFTGFGILVVGAIIQATSHNLAQFIVSRLIIGSGTAFVGIASPILITELAYPTQRGQATSLYNTCFFVGAIIASWSTYGTFRIPSSWSWRIPSALQAALPILQCCLLFFVPESPRWLVANDRSEEAKNILVKFHAGGDDASLLVDFELKEITEAIRLERIAKTQGSYLDLLRTAPNRWRAFIAVSVGVFVAWNGSAILSYYLTLVLDTIGITTTAEQALINGLLQIFNWFSAIFGGALLVERVGRRLLFLVSTGGMLIIFIIYTILTSIFATTQQKSVGYASLVMIFVFSFFLNIAWTPLLQAYPVEIFQYGQRARGLTLVYAANYLMFFISAFCNSIALSAIGWKYYIFFDVMLAIIWGTIYFAYPETKGRTLEEIAEIFDGKKLIVGDELNKEITEEVKVDVKM